VGDAEADKGLKDIKDTFLSFAAKTYNIFDLEAF
jgi:hypothetical protein